MKSYIISLQDRQDRFDQSYPLLTERGFDVRRYTAHRLFPGWMGCTASHLGALASIGPAPFAIFEDDLEFIADISIVHSAMQQVDFDMMFLGCDPQEKMTKVSENALKIGRIHQTHAIIYGSDRVVDFILSKRNDIRKIDIFFSEQVIPNFKCYTTYPMVCKQTDGLSDITGAHIDFNYVLKSFEDMIE